MSWWRRPDVLLLLALLALTAGGAVVLNTRFAKQLDPRDWEAYGNYNAWSAAFDAASAACGAGLLTTDFVAEYTVVGRWILTGLGLLGAITFLLAARAATQCLWDACGERVPLPSGRLIVLVFLIVCAGSIPAVGVAERLAGGDAGLSETFPRALAASASLGWPTEAWTGAVLWIYAAIAVISAVGWTVWIAAVPGLRKRHIYLPRVLLIAGSYLLFLLAATVLLVALEAPRGPTPRRTADGALTAQPAAAGWQRAAVQVVLTPTAGIPVAATDDRELRSGSRLLLAGLILVGPVGGAPGGGLRWTLLLMAFAAALGLGAVRGRSLHPASLRATHAAVSCGAATLILFLVTAYGILLIEGLSATPFRSPPDAADALLDAAAAVGGAGLTSGAVEAITDRNLSSGIRQGADLYQYGMLWLMLAMLLGRTLPVWALRRAAQLALRDDARGTPPIA